MLSSAGVAPLPPGFHRLLSVTVTTFAVFLSWMHLLVGVVCCHLVRVTPAIAVGKVAKFARR